jgi:phasin family protein
MAKKVSDPAAVQPPVEAVAAEAPPAMPAAAPAVAVAAAPEAPPVPQHRPHAAKTKETAKMVDTVKSAEEFFAFGQANVEAFLKSGQIWSAGVQDIGKQVAATAQAQVDQTVATFKALTGVKSFKEAFDLQSSLARTALEKVVADASKLTDASLKLSEETFAPIAARVQLAVEKFGRPV